MQNGAGELSPVRSEGMVGASRRNRTDDRLFTKQLLLPAELERRTKNNVRTMGVEPMWSGWKPGA